MGVPGEKPLGARERTNNKLNPHMPSMPGVEPGHIGGRRALSPLRHPLLLKYPVSHTNHAIICLYYHLQKVNVVIFTCRYFCL